LIDPIRVFALASVLGALGMWMFLPPCSNRGRWIGGLLIAGALGLGTSQMHWLGGWVADSILFLLAGVTIIGALATVTPPRPERCAMGIGLTMVGAGGLIVFGGVWLPAAIAMIGFGGVILAACLWVLRRAQPADNAPYDQTSWEPLLSAAAGAAIVAVLAMTVCGVAARVLGAGQSVAAGQRTELVLLSHYLVIGAVLFGVGLIGFMSRRNMVVMLLAAGVMLLGVLLSLAAFGQLHGDSGGRLLACFAVGLAASEGAIGLALVWKLHLQTGEPDPAVRHAPRPAQNGLIQFYALAMVVGLLVLMGVSAP
jgi:NADH:ubiquinone oxidoreductase subunit K